MNNVNLIGRIATESKQNSGSVSSLLAVKRIYKSKDNVDADFIPLIIFGNNADNFIKFVKKGQQIGVSGAIKTGEYVDGTGQKRYSWSVIVNHFYLLSSDNHDHHQSYQQPAQQQPYQQPVQQQPAQQQPYQSPSHQQYRQPVPQQSAPQQQQLQKSSIIVPQSDSEQSKQWQILSKQLDEIEHEQQEQKQPYKAPQQQPQPQQPYQPQQPLAQPSAQQQGGIPFD